MAALVVVLLGLAPASAAADWYYYFTPFVGMKFGGSTTLFNLGLNEGARKVVIGGSVAILTDGLVGVEADYGFYPGFFQKDDRLVVESNSVHTLTGNLLLAAPLELTRESLRPYVVGGVGWMNAAITDALAILPEDEDFVALNVGVGAIGMLGDRVGLRFDLRHYSNLDRGEPSGTSLSSPRLKFWRATVGVTIRD